MLPNTLTVLLQTLPPVSLGSANTARDEVTLLLKRGALHPDVSWVATPYPVTDDRPTW